MKAILRTLSILTLLALALSAPGVRPVQAADACMVTSAADSGAGSLRQWIANCAADGTITFDTSLSGATVSLTSALAVSKNLTIDASALSTPVTLKQTVSAPVVTITAVTVILKNLIITGGTSSQGGGISASGTNLTVVNSVITANHSTFAGSDHTGFGGGIYLNGGTLTLTETVFSNNTAMYGGGVGAEGSTIQISDSDFLGNSGSYGGGIISVTSTISIANSTFSGNTAVMGGGLQVDAGGTATLINDTFSGNGASTAADVLNLAASTLHMTNTIIANPTAGGDCINYGALATNQNNLIEDGSCPSALSGDPHLGALADNNSASIAGGQVIQTFALLEDSPAIDAGNSAACAAAPVNGLDARGVSRTQYGNCDIGAVERDQVVPISTAITRVDADPTWAAEVHFTVTFNQPVSGVDASDFELTTTGISEAAITGVSGSGKVYTITIFTGTSAGTLRLDIPTTAVIQGQAGATWSGSYTDGESYTVILKLIASVPVLVSPKDKALVTTFQPTLEWSDAAPMMSLSANPWSYEINVTGENGSYDQTFNTASGLENSSYTFASPLAANSTYSWKVRSVNDQGKASAWSALRSFKTKLAAPALDQPAAYTTLDNIRPDFTWDEVPGAVSYTLQISKDSKAVVTATIKTPNLTYTPTKDLLPGTTYFWRVKANPSGGYSGPQTFTTSPNPPKIPVLTAPGNSALIATNPAQALAWKPVTAVTTKSALTSYPAADHYEIQYANTITFSGTTLATTTSTTAQATIVTLPGRPYYWRVRVWSAGGAHSAWSSVRLIRVKFAAPTLTSPGSAATGVSNRPTFTWDINGNGLWTNCTVQVANDAAFKKGLRSFTVSTPATTYTLPGTLPALTSGLKYWRVKINGAYTPIFSAVSSFTVQ